MLRRLPGIQVIAQSPQKSRLPRMDVACFVGFAERGPLHRPVLIRNLQAYGQVFGGYLALAQRAGAIQLAYLTSAVRTFFANGGQLCYVIRIANAAEALRNQNFFPLAGMAAAVPNGDNFDFRPAYMRASSLGSWSDNLRLRTNLLVDILNITSLQFDSRQLTTPTKEVVHVGDMLKLSYRNEQYYVPVNLVQPNPGGDGWRVRWSGSQLLRTQLPTEANLSSLAVLRWMSNWGTETSTGVLSHAIEDETTGRLQLVIERPTTIPPIGTLFWATFTNRLLLSATHITVNPADDSQLIIRGRALLWLTGNPVPTGGILSVERLSFSLQTVQGDAPPKNLNDLAFAPEHPRYWGALPDDQLRYGDSPGPLAQEGLAEQFPLAGLLSKVPYLPEGRLDTLPLEAIRTPLLTIPVGMGTLPIADARPVRLTVTPLERDGLSEFGAALFLDEDLPGNTIHTLLSHADDIRYRNHYTRDLQGIHAALSLVDASLIAIPDLLHSGWKPTPVYTPTPPKPSDPVTHPGWSGHKCEPDLEDDALTEPQWQHFLDHGLRVIEAPTLETGTETNGSFTLTWEPDEVDRIFYLEEVTRFDWSLEEATRFDWSDATQIYEGSETSRIIYGRGVGDYYYRVRLSVGKNKSDWSDGVVVSVTPASGWEMLAPATANDIIYRLVQHELLRMCAVKGTLFAVLGIPAWYREADAVAYAEALQPASEAPLNAITTDSLPLNYMEQVALSYGSLFHPWLHVNDGQTIRLLPPHGTMSGMIARRANTRGAWIAPANQVLEAIIALQPNLPATAWASLLTTHINIIQRHPRGFLTLSTDTLHPDSEWREINVRRLMILLRRVLLPLADTYVFEPNNRILERAVGRDVNALLNDLFRRGAFAGNTPAEAYQVRLLSTPDDKAKGRFIVEIKVAPALPMSFITIHLIQSNVPRIEEV